LKNVQTRLLRNTPWLPFLPNLDFLKLINTLRDIIVLLVQNHMVNSGISIVLIFLITVYKSGLAQYW
jgi:hypothetical protein